LKVGTYWPAAAALVLWEMSYPKPPGSRGSPPGLPRLWPSLARRQFQAIGQIPPVGTPRRSWRVRHRSNTLAASPIECAPPTNRYGASRKDGKSCLPARRSRRWRAAKRGKHPIIFRCGSSVSRVVATARRSKEVLHPQSTTPSLAPRGGRYKSR
jgi:hypothetical protein